jgi:hypothetical protein
VLDGGEQAGGVCLVVANNLRELASVVMEGGGFGFGWQDERD